MNRISLGLLTRRARVALNAWNDQHPDEQVPWETLEEVVMAFDAGCRAAEADDPDAFQEAAERVLTFAPRIPENLLAAIKLK